MEITGGCLCKAVRYSLNVRAGTLDDRELARPAATIWTTSAPSWACFDERIPRVERQPPPPVAAPPAN